MLIVFFSWIPAFIFNKVQRQQSLPLSGFGIEPGQVGRVRLPTALTGDNPARCAPAKISGI